MTMRLPLLYSMLALLIAGQTPALMAARSPSDPASQPQPIAPLPTNMPATTLDAIRERAAKFKAVVSVPKLETSPAEIQSAVTNTIARANLSLGEIASCRHDWINFANTVGALDDLVYEATTTADRMQLLKDTSTNAAVRDAAAEA